MPRLAVLGDQLVAVLVGLRLCFLTRHRNSSLPSRLLKNSFNSLRPHPAIDARRGYAVSNSYRNWRHAVFLPQLSGGDMRALGHRFELRPCDLAVDTRGTRNRAEAAIGPRDNVFATDHVRDVADSLRHHLRVLDEVRHRIDHSRNQHLAVGQLYVLEHGPFMLVARV